MAVNDTPSNAAGTTLSYKIGAASTFSPVATLQETSGPSESVAKIDTTYLSAEIKTYIPSIPDPGEVSFTIFAVYGDAAFIALAALVAAPQVASWQLQANDGTSPTTGSTATFRGFLTKFDEKDYKIDGTPVADITLQVSGTVTRTPGT